MTEAWLPCPGFEAVYSVSDLGRVRRDAGGSGARPGVPLRLIRRPDGYLKVNLWKNNVCTSRLVHQLVCEAFHGPAPAGHEVRHLDGDRTNNTPDNVVWGTRGENALDRTRHGTQTKAGYRHVRRMPTAKLTDGQVEAIRVDRRTYKVIATEFGTHASTVCQIKRGVTYKPLQQEQF